ncbi:Undecaprenyl-phosphate N-acetylglucosaminyl 1-phosphate transferase [Enhygromyxa salina]|uniref:Undecaprenyl-phosphate N-acetylglucosaminyl 1-phosphate transferase n=1 Tax=Enhygromyxa salina TaxID=215803 RepID=A0A0C2D983_9BACT|nr:nucleotidyltransferase domain-containing protein [Enhygromyxa salina]KIG16542.1 Undecaprenyl-phosphate N-acetylglucosaminyl 1-phosphate transferase [Enhygromyxa salina]
MKIRIKGLEDIDPLRVPLPHGTEVTTRVDREFQGRVVTQGAVGRVKAIEGSAVTVHVVGVGNVRYAREELTPRKAGQLEFAVRREAAWQALRGNAILETVVGSRAWGLAEQGSDTDRRGVFVLPFVWTTALVDPPTDLVSADGSENLWEVGKALRQAIRADPNTLETLLLNGATATDPMGEWTLEIRDAFVSSEIYGTFGRYALSQLTRLEQGLRLAEHRRLLLAWLAQDPSLSLDQAAAKLAVEAKIEGHTEADKTRRAKDYIKQLYSSMFDQGLLGDRDYAALVGFAQSEQHRFDLPRELRPKNAYNLLRLLATATNWLRTGTAQFEMTGDLRLELLAIKRQEVELAKVIQRAQELAAELEDARRATKLPQYPDVGRIDQLLRRIREEASRRWHAGEAGPFGADASELPLAEWH